MYSRESTLDLSPIYDDMMENLKVRYVLTFKAPGGGSNVTHTLRVDLIDPASGKPLEIADAAGRSLLEGLPAAVYTCYAAGYITFFNEAAAAVWGRRPELQIKQW